MFKLTHQNVRHKIHLEHNTLKLPYNSNVFELLMEKIRLILGFPLGIDIQNEIHKEKLL